MSYNNDSTGQYQSLVGVIRKNADWHPFNVWRNNMRSEQGSDSSPTDAGDGNWNPYTVWKKQIKRD